MENIIQEDQAIRNALCLIDKLAENDILTLYVVNKNDTLVGCLTEGDIRRFIVGGGTLESSVCQAMNTSFTSIKSSDTNNISKLKDSKLKGICRIPCTDDEGHIIEDYDLVHYRSHLPIDAVLMAGGKGERLRPLTEKTPKPLLQMESKPIIDYIVDHILSFGIRNISVTVNYLKEQIEEHFAEPVRGVQVKTVREPKFLGTIGSLHYVKDLHNDTVLLMNSDAITDIDLEDYYLHFKQHEADMSVAAIPYTISIPYGIFELDGRDIKGVLEKPTYNYYANAGIYLIKRELLDLIPEGEFFNATDFMDMLLGKTPSNPSNISSLSNSPYKVIRYPLNGTWIDIGNPQEYKKATEMIKHMKW